MSQQEFYVAHVPEPHRLLGVDLLPFSLGHLILLRRLESAFVTGGTPQMDDLVSAVFICSQTYSEAAEVLNTGEVDYLEPRLFFGNRVVRLPLAEAMRRWQQIAGEFDFNDRMEAFRIYMKAGSKHPLVSSVHGFKEDTMPSNCPFVQVVKATLMSRMNFHESELLDRSWSLCLWDYFTLRMLDGDLRIVDRDALSDAQGVADAVQEKINKGELRFAT